MREYFLVVSERSKIYSLIPFNTMKVAKFVSGFLIGFLAIPMAFAETFSDLDAFHENYLAIEYLVSIGTIEGYSDNTYKPDQTVNRAELMKILVAGQGISPDETVYQNCFPDVTTDWYAKYVCYAYEQGWVDGYPDSTFKPAQTVNKVEALKMLVNALGLNSMLPTEVYGDLYDDTDSSAWYAPYLSVAKNLNLLEVTTGDYEPSGEMNRGWVAEYIFRTLVVNEMEIDAFDEDSKNEFLELKGLTSLLDDQEFNAVELSGSGATVSDSFYLEEGLAVVDLSHSGTSNFSVRLLSTTSDDTEYLVNEIGSYGGMMAFYVDEAGEYIFDIDADGGWSIVLEQPRYVSGAEFVESFSGEGAVVTDYISVEEGLAVFDFTHDGESNFIVQVLDESGETVAYLANEIGSYEGSVAEYLDEEVYRFFIDADGAWTMNFDQVDFGQAITETSFSGQGDDTTAVFYTDGGLKTFSFTHQGDSNFIVHLLNSEGQSEAYLVNEIGDYEGSTAEYLDAGYYIMNVQADGGWTIGY